MTEAFRWLHVVAGGAWLGEVVVITFVLVPMLGKLEPDRRTWMISTLFPRLFRLASVLIFGALVGGALLHLSMTDWRVDMDLLTGTRWGRLVATGGTLGLALGLFHYVAESKLEPMARDVAITGETDLIVKRLKVIPRVGLGILVVVFTTMILA